MPRYSEEQYEEMKKNLMSRIDFRGQVLVDNKGNFPNTRKDPFEHHRTPKFHEENPYLIKVAVDVYFNPVYGGFLHEPWEEENGI